MSETTAGRVLSEHPAIVDLIKILEGNNPAAAGDLTELAKHFSGMEELLQTANRELTSMRRELAELRELHGEPLHTVAQEEIRFLDKALAQLGDRLGAVKDWIVHGAQDAATAFRERGVEAMSRAVSFLGIRKELEYLHRDMRANVALRDMSIAKIENVSRQYHAAGTAVRNMGRAMIGMETLEDTKPAGKLAALAIAPHKVLKGVDTGIAAFAEAALDKLGRLENRATAQKDSLLGKLDTHRQENELEGKADFRKLQDCVKAYGPDR